MAGRPQCHAGAEHGKDIEAQKEGRLLWVTVKGYPRDTQRTNATVQAPHWFKDAMFDRSLVGMIQRRLDQRLAPIVVVRGPRQIGKTTAQLHIIADMLAHGVQANRILRVQFDETAGLEKFQEPIRKTPSAR